MIKEFERIILKYEALRKEYHNAIKLYDSFIKENGLAQSFISWVKNRKV